MLPMQQDSNSSTVQEWGSFEEEEIIIYCFRILHVKIYLMKKLLFQVMSIQNYITRQSTISRSL